MNYLPSEWLKLTVMSPLALRVKRLGVCPGCHKKSLNDLGPVTGGFTVHQCSACKSAYLDQSPEIEGAEHEQ